MTKEIPYICPLCKKEFTENPALVKTMKDIENEWLKYAAQLVNHVRHTHYVANEKTEAIRWKPMRLKKMNSDCKSKIIECAFEMFPKAYSLQLFKGMLKLEDNNERMTALLHSNIRKITNDLKRSVQK